MTFAIRQIDLLFESPEQNLPSVYLPNIKCNAVITNPGGYNGFGQLQLKVWGMTMDQMNQYSSVGTNMVALNKQRITVYAGDKGAAMHRVFTGSIISSYLDFSAQPDISFTCAACAGYSEKGTPSAPNTNPNSNNAEDIIASLVSQMGSDWTFRNPQKAHSVLQNQYLYGSVIDQITSVAKAAKFPLKVENNIVTIWPNDGYIDNEVIEIGPATGMVGYPSYYEAGFIVKAEFNPSIENGKAVNLTSGIPKANGKFPVIQSTHELTTLTPDGPWFTTFKLAPFPYVPNN